MEHLDHWPATPGSLFHHVFLHIESFGRVAPFLIGRLDNEERATSPLMIRPLSHTGVRIHKATTLDELYGPDGKIREDGTFLNEHQDVLDLILAHTAGEGIRFGLRS